MDIIQIYTREPLSALRPAIFLAGPSPRGNSSYAWRPEAMRLIEASGFKGVVYNPENRSEYKGGGTGYYATWEDMAVEVSDVILFWVPRDMDHLIGLTTNVEFGLYCKRAGTVYGRPDGAPHTAYLDHVWKRFGLGEPCRTLFATVQEAMGKLGLRKT